jgi:hypothetical protein
MAYAFVQTLKGMEDADYDRIKAELGDDVPDGLILHVAGPVEGGYRYLDVWESKEQWAHFHDELLHPLLERAGILALAGKRIFSVEEPLLDVRHLFGNGVSEPLPA